MPHVMTDALREFLAAYLVNAAWQAPVVAFCAFLAARFGGLSAGARNRLWLAALVAATVLPAISLGSLLPRAVPTVARVEPGAAVTLAATPVATAEAAPAAEPALQLAPWSAWLMIGLLALIAAALIARIAVASAAARRLVRQSSPAVLPAEVTQALERLARVHHRTVPPVRTSRGVRSPAVVGALAPVILVPHDLAADGDELRAALLHELAHVLRHDYAVNLACELLTLPVCWHPATLGIKAGVRRSRELACDAIAAQAMGSPKAYARRLVSLAQTLGAQPLGAAALAGSGAPANAALAVGLFGRSDLEDRLMQLMKPTDAEGPALRAARLCGLAAVGASLLGSAALLHVTPVFAKDARAVPSSLVEPALPAMPAVPALPALPAVPALPALAAVGAVPAVPAIPAVPAVPAGPHISYYGHNGVIVSKKGVILHSGAGHSHSWTGADGRTITVVNDSEKDPSPTQKREWEAVARDAEAQGAAAEKLVNAPEFKARVEKAKAAGEAARKLVESPEFKARIAKAEADAKAAEAMVNSPEFKARIAAAQAAGEAARKMVESPEFKARIAQAKADGEAARAYVESPEFKANIARIKAEALALQRRMDAIDDEDRTPRAP
jgi:beta-lactamase regulating signal transducer with metallopeptidase domain